MTTGATLSDLGWAREQAEGLEREPLQVSERPARVSSRVGRHYTVVDVDGEQEAWLPGRLAREPADEPAVGDWVVAEVKGDRLVIDRVLPRRSTISRLAAGGATREQVVAANVDTVFVTMGLDDDFNLRRLERFLAVAYEGGVDPVVVLNKRDLDDDHLAHRAAASGVAPGVEIHCTCALTGVGVDELRAHLGPGRTVALIGSSGAGKSTLANCLAGRELMPTGVVRERDGRGQHTTTRRHLLRLPDGSLLIDNPGLREVAAWSEGDEWRRAFAELEEIGERCRFRDCRHQGEPGCAVEAAVEAGELPTVRLESWRSLESEARALRGRRDEAERRRERRMASRSMKKHKPRTL